MPTNEIKERVIQIIKEHQKQANAWVPLNCLGEPLQEIKDMFHCKKLSECLQENFSDVLEFRFAPLSAWTRPKMQKAAVTAKPTAEEAAEKLQISTEGGTHISSMSMPVTAVSAASEALAVPDAAKPDSFPISQEESGLFVKLAAMALPEPWDYGRPQAGPKKMHILRRYLFYTYERLLFEQKVLYAEDPDTGVRYGAFNTGLVDRKYDAIYALLREVPAKKGPHWVIDHFVLAGEGKGKCLTKLFRSFPQKADYTHCEGYGKCLCLKKSKFACDYSHMIEDRLGRMPYEFLKSFSNRLPRIEGMTLDEAYAASEKGRPYERYFRKLGQVIASDPVLFTGLKNRLQAAVDMALKRQTWDLRTAVLSYNPDRKKCCWLLPLILVEGHSADCALVVERMKSGAYQGHTILLLSWAYKNSRYITRPNSDWLSPELIAPEAEGETDTFEPMGEAFPDALDVAEPTDAGEPMDEELPIVPEADEPTVKVIFASPEAEEEADTFEPMDEELLAAPDEEEETYADEPTDEEFPAVSEAELAADGLVQQTLFGEPVTVPEETAAAASKKLTLREVLPEENDRLECGDLFA